MDNIGFDIAKFDQMLLDHATKGLVDRLGFCPGCAKILVTAYSEEQDRILLEGDPDSSCHPTGILQCVFEDEKERR